MDLDTSCASRSFASELDWEKVCRRPVFGRVDRRFGPDFVLSGHIHNAPFYSEGSWIDRIDKTWVFNPGRQIGQRPTSIVFDLETMRVEWFSLEGECLKCRLVESGEVSAPVASAGDA
jgi:predicted phosphodiesterase